MDVLLQNFSQEIAGDMSGSLSYISFHPECYMIARLNELIKLQTEVSAEQNKKDEGKEFTILIENFSKRSREQMMGRTEQNKAVVIDKGNHHIGEFVKVRITGSTSATLFGEEVKE